MNARSGTSPTRRKCWSSSIPNALDALAPLGTSCPDHFLRTKIRPLVLPYDPGATISMRLPDSLDDRLEAYRRRLRRLLRALQATEFAGHARSQRGGLPGSRHRHDFLRQGQGDRADRLGVLRQRHQRDARRLRRRQLSRPARAGSLRHRILAAGGGQAAAHAQAEIAGRPDRLCHRRRRRHRWRGGATAAGRRRLRRPRRHRPGSA